MIALENLRDLLILFVPITYDDLIKLFSPKTLIEFEYVKLFEKRMKKKVKFLRDLIKELL